jgi:hypothetical protein
MHQSAAVSSHNTICMGKDYMDKDFMFVGSSGDASGGYSITAPILLPHLTRNLYGRGGHLHSHKESLETSLWRGFVQKCGGSYELTKSVTQGTRTTCTRRRVCGRRAEQDEEYEATGPIRHNKIVKTRMMTTPPPATKVTTKS